MGNKQMLKKILVPTDGSLASLIAEEMTAFLVKKFKSRVTVFHVIAHEFMNPRMQTFTPESFDYIPTPLGGGPPILIKEPKPDAHSVPREVFEEISSSYRLKAEEVIADAIAVFKEEGIRVDQKIAEHPDPADAILRETQERDYDTIIMGRSGEEEHKGRLGSVAEKVSRHSQIPVLIVGEKRKISRILVPVDGSENAEKVVEYGAYLAGAVDATLTLLHIQETGIFRLRPELTKEVGTRILSMASERARGVRVDQKLESGDPAEMIIQTTTKGDYDLIVMGGKGHNAAERFLLGSVSDHVIHYTDRSVLLVK